MWKAIITFIVFSCVSYWSWSASAQDQVSGSGSKPVIGRSSRTSLSKRPICSQKNNYLQATLNTLAAAEDNGSHINTRLLQVGSAYSPVISRDCIDSALENVTAGDAKKANEKFRTNRFIKCENDIPVDHQDEPCMSNEYKRLLHNSFEYATACLKDFVTGSKVVEVQNTWVEGYFKMIAKESGMHANVASRIGAIATSQLRPEFIADFKQRTLPGVRRHLLRKDSPAVCQLIATQLLTDEKIEKLYSPVQLNDPQTGNTVTRYKINTCANIDLNADQPLLGILISFSHLKRFKESGVDSVINDPEFKDLFKLLSPEERIDLEIKLTSWSYNVGPSLLRSHLKNLLKKVYLEQGQPVTDVRSFIVSAQIEGKRNYVFGLEDRYKLVLKNRKSCRTDKAKPAL